MCIVYYTANSYYFVANSYNSLTITISELADIPLNKTFKR